MLSYPIFWNPTFAFLFASLNLYQFPASHWVTVLPKLLFMIYVFNDLDSTIFLISSLITILLDHYVVATKFIQLFASVSFLFLKVLEYIFSSDILPTGSLNSWYHVCYIL